MKNLVKIHAAVAMLLLSACANQIETKIPDNIEVTGEPTLTIRHEITITAELNNVFEDECSKEFPNGTEAELQLCRDKKAKDYIDQFLALINQQGAQ